MRFDEPAGPVPVETRSAQGVSLATPSLRYDFGAPQPGALLMRVRGAESGELGNRPFDVLDGLLARLAKPRLYIDLSAVDHVSPAVAECWSAWLAAREVELQQVVVHAETPQVALLVLPSQYRFRSPSRMLIVREAGDFQRRLNEGAGAGPGSAA